MQEGAPTRHRSSDAPSKACVGVVVCDVAKHALEGRLDVRGRPPAVQLARDRSARAGVATASESVQSLAENALLVAQLECRHPCEIILMNIPRREWRGGVFSGVTLRTVRPQVVDLELLEHFGIRVPVSPARAVRTLEPAMAALRSVSVPAAAVRGPPAYMPNPMRCVLLVRETAVIRAPHQSSAYWRPISCSSRMNLANWKLSHDLQPARGGVAKSGGPAAVQVDVPVAQ